MLPRLATCIASRGLGFQVGRTHVAVPVLKEKTHLWLLSELCVKPGSGCRGTVIPRSLPRGVVQSGVCGEGPWALLVELACPCQALPGISRMPSLTCEVISCPLGQAFLATDSTFMPTILTVGTNPLSEWSLAWPKGSGTFHQTCCSTQGHFSPLRVPTGPESGHRAGRDDGVPVQDTSEVGMRDCVHLTRDLIFFQSQGAGRAPTCPTEDAVLRAPCQHPQQCHQPVLKPVPGEGGVRG